VREYPCFNKRWDEQLILALSAGDMDMKKMKWQNGKKSGQLTAFLLAGSILICLLSGCGSNGAKGDLADEAKSVETAETNAGSQVTAPGETAGMTSEPAGTAGTGQAKEAAESGETGAPAESKETAAAADSARIDEILQTIPARRTEEQMAARRKAFVAKMPEMRLSRPKIEGLTPQQEQYVRAEMLARKRDNDAL
jgi:hypothetical protein